MASLCRLSTWQRFRNIPNNLNFFAGMNLLAKWSNGATSSRGKPTQSHCVPEHEEEAFRLLWWHISNHLGWREAASGWGRTEIAERKRSTQAIRRWGEEAGGKQVLVEGKRKLQHEVDRLAPFENQATRSSRTEQSTPGRGRPIGTFRKPGPESSSGEAAAPSSSWPTGAFRDINCRPEEGEEAALGWSQLTYNFRNRRQLAKEGSQVSEAIRDRSKAAGKGELGTEGQISGPTRQLRRNQGSGVQGRRRQGTISAWHGDCRPQPSQLQPWTLEELCWTAERRKGGCREWKSCVERPAHGHSSPARQILRDADAKKQKIDDLEGENRTLASTIQRLQPLERTVEDVQGELQRTKSELTKLNKAELRFLTWRRRFPVWRRRMPSWSSRSSTASWQILTRFALRPWRQRRRRASKTPSPSTSWPRQERLARTTKQLASLICLGGSRNRRKRQQVWRASSMIEPVK